MGDIASPFLKSIMWRSDGQMMDVFEWPGLRVKLTTSKKRLVSSWLCASRHESSWDLVPRELLCSSCFEFIFAILWANLIRVCSHVDCKVGRFVLNVGTSPALVDPCQKMKIASLLFKWIKSSSFRYYLSFFEKWSMFYDGRSELVGNENAQPGRSEVVAEVGSFPTYIYSSSSSPSSPSSHASNHPPTNWYRKVIISIDHYFEIAAVIPLPLFSARPLQAKAIKDGPELSGDCSYCTPTARERNSKGSTSSWRINPRASTKPNNGSSKLWALHIRRARDNRCERRRHPPQNQGEDMDISRCRQSIL